MADTALHQLRGILAATMTQPAIDQLLSEVAEEVVAELPLTVTMQLPLGSALSGIVRDAIKRGC